MPPVSQTTIISGAARGIGRACADRLSNEGHHVIGLGRTEPDDNFPGDFHCVDFTSRKDVSALCGFLSSKVEVTGIINNVGEPGPELIEDIDLLTVDRVLEINFYSAIQLVKYFTPAMKSQGYGRILSISSELALGLPSRTAYGAAKAALVSATRTWALELASSGVCVNAIAPGPVDTEFFNRNNPPGSEVRKIKENKIPLGNIGQPEDIAHVASFLMSPDTRFITGQTIFVDGGSSLGATSLL